MNLGEALTPDAIVEIGLVPTGSHNKGPDLLLTGSHSKGSNRLQDNHRIKLEGNNKLCHRDKKNPSKIRDDKQSRIMLMAAVEQISEILYAILANKERSLCK